MKLRLALMIIANLNLSLAFTQNYVPLNPSRVAVFNNISEEHSYITVDSVLSNELELFYLNRVVDYSDYRCVVLDKPSFLGEKLLVHPNGYCFFFNKNNDSIFIKQSALLNESWIAYSDSSMLIEARVLAHDVQSFLSLSDSVKTIGFMAFTNTGDSISHPINNMQLALSKNYGMVQAVNFLNFSESINDYGQYHLIGLSEPEVGVQNLKWFDVFDFQVNDEIHVFEINADWEGTDGSSSTRKIIFKYIDRKDFADSIIYTVDRAIEHQYRTKIIDSTWTTFDTIVTVVRQNENFDYLPDYPVFYDNRTAFGINSQFSVNGLTRKLENYYAFVFVDSVCWSIIHYSGFYGYNYYKALGGPYYKSDMGPAISYERNLIYYKKGSLEWGSAFVITDVESTQISNEIKVYPNPASNYIYVDVQKISEGLTFELFDWSGRLVLKKTVSNNIELIDISHLKNGFYFFNIGIIDKVFKSEKVIISKH